MGGVGRYPVLAGNSEKLRVVWADKFRLPGDLWFPTFATGRSRKGGARGFNGLTKDGRQSCTATGLRLILLVTHLLHPIYGFAVEFLLDRDVGHCGGWRRAVPVLFSGREPDDVAGADFFDGAAQALRAAEAGGDDEGLAERVRMPGGAGTGLEGDMGANDSRWVGRVKQH